MRPIMRVGVMKCMSEAVYVVSHYSVSRTALNSKLSKGTAVRKHDSREAYFLLM